MAKRFDRESTVGTHDEQGIILMLLSPSYAWLKAAHAHSSTLLWYGGLYKLAQTKQTKQGLEDELTKVVYDAA